MADEQYIEIIRAALEEGNLLKAEFYKDGSGVYFHIRNNVTRETRAISLKMEEAVKCLAGFRLKQHEIIHCM